MRGGFIELTTTDVVIAIPTNDSVGHNAMRMIKMTIVIRIVTIVVSGMIDNLCPNPSYPKQLSRRDKGMIGQWYRTILSSSSGMIQRRRRRSGGGTVTGGQGNGPHHDIVVW